MSLNISIIGIHGSGKSLVNRAPAGPAASGYELTAAYQPEEIFGHRNLPLSFGGQAINYRSRSSAAPDDTTVSAFTTLIKPLHNLIYLIRLVKQQLKQPASYLTAWKKPALITFCRSLKPTLSVASKRVQSYVLCRVTLRPGFNNDENSA